MKLGWPGYPKSSEWQCTDAAKRKRIVESLKGHAADIVRFLKVSTPTATAMDYLFALDAVYGTTESGAENLAKFRHTFQNEEESWISARKGKKTNVTSAATTVTPTSITSELIKNKK